MSGSRFLFDRDLLLRAGAGTGKTYALVTQYLHLVSGLTARRAPSPPSRVVAITFTEKAAAELAQKIRERVAHLADGDLLGEPDLYASAQELGVPLPPAAAWAECLGALGGAPVGTFHKLGGALIRRHAVAAGIDPGYRTLDDAESHARLTRAAEEVVLEGLSRGDRDVEALVDELGYQGTGFATGLVEVLVSLHQRRNEEGRAAAGLADGYREERLAAEHKHALDTLRIATRAMMDVRRHLVAKSLEKLDDLESQLPRAIAAMLARSDDGRELVRRLADTMKGAKAGGKGDAAAVTAALAGLRAACAQAQASIVSYRAAPLARTIERLVGEVATRYRDDKRRLGALDFSDLLLEAVALLERNPGVLADEQARIDALLVDEFQDTNEVQARLVRLLAGRPARAAAAALAREEPPSGRLVVVGDRKQSIYEFRGADVAVSVAFDRERVAEHGARRASLTVSRRSRPALVELANALFGHLMRPTGDGATAADFAIHFDEDDRLTPLRAEGEEACAELIAVPRADPAPDSATLRLAEASALARRLAELRDAGVGTASTALLLRAFTHLDVYLDALRACGLPYYVVNGRGFFEAQEVRDLAAALRLLDDPDDAAALLTVLRSPLVALSDVSLVRLALADAHGGTLSAQRLRRAMQRTPLGPDEAARLDRYLALHDSLVGRADRLGGAGCLRAIVDGTDLVPVLAGGYHGEQRVANLERLVDRARAMETAGTDLRGFVRWLSTLAADGEAPRSGSAQAQIVAETDDVVRVMTVHQSKGLEFAVVAIAGCGSPEAAERDAVLYDAAVGIGLRLHAGPGDNAPSTSHARVKAAREARRDAESLRLFYVAVTRARDHLLLSGEATRGGRSWRSLVDEAMQQQPDVAARLVTRSLRPALRVLPRADALAASVGTHGRPRALAARHEAGEGDTAAADPPTFFSSQQAALPFDVPAAPSLDRLSPRPAEARRLVVAVTQLADFALCPRRYHLFHEVGLAEHPTPARAASTDVVSFNASGERTLDPLGSGTLAHHLLELADLDAAGADLDRLLDGEGYDTTAPEVAAVRDHVRAFLATPFARDLAARARDGRVTLRRELPFVLSLPCAGGLRLELRGQIDLVVLDGESVTVIDYKHARASSAADYRMQLDAYALAASHLFSDARRVRVGLAFLRDADPSPLLEEHDAARGARFQEELSSLGSALARARTTPAASLASRAAPDCRANRCGYVYRCHPGERA